MMFNDLPGIEKQQIRKYSQVTEGGGEPFLVSI